MKTAIVMLLTAIGVIDMSMMIMDDPVAKAPNPNDTYCISMKDSVKILMMEKKQITIDMPLADGSILKPNGILLKQDGTKVELKDGQCINQEGVITGKPEDGKESGMNNK